MVFTGHSLDGCLQIVFFTGEAENPESSVWLENQAVTVHFLNGVTHDGSEAASLLLCAPRLDELCRGAVAPCVWPGAGWIVIPGVA